jgi:hypothetical protein
LKTELTVLLFYLQNPCITHSNTGGFYEVETLSQGFRACPNIYNLKLRQDLEPILAVGDSFTFGSEVNDSETWPSHLQNFSKVKVLNGGVSGYGLDQTYLLLEQLIENKQVRPSVVILSLTPLNIERTNLTSRLKSLTGHIIHKPYITVDETGLTHFHYPKVVEEKEETKINPLRYFLGFSLVLDTLFKEISPYWWWKMVSEKNLGKEFRTSHDNQEVSRILIRKISEMANREGFKLVLLRQDFFQPLNKRHPLYQSDSALDSLTLWIKSQGLNMVDLNPVLKSLFETNQRKYRSLFLPGHMTNQGNLFVAQELWSHLKGIALFSNHEVK